MTWNESEKERKKERNPPNSRLHVNDTLELDEKKEKIVSYWRKEKKRKFKFILVNLL